MVDAAFAQRRKTLRAALARLGGVAPAAAEQVLRAAGIDPALRGEALGVAEFARIAAAGRAARLATPAGSPRHGVTAYDRQIVTPVTVRVPAKVNLQLSVGPPRADGYHDLVTVFHAVSLYDEVTVRPGRPDQRCR